ncbi:MAG: glutamate racemase [Deltaproteobacteria bacterium]|nr:glutamate racemase [Deltaproteobacteria bacterium]
MQASQKIGVFDSGVGGLTVMKALMQRLPAEDLVYLGDTARVPYGTKSAEVVTRYSLLNARFLLKHDVKAIVIACNTASAASLPVLENELPVPVVGVIGPGAQAAARATKSGRVGVIGTQGTIRSEAYQRALREARPEVNVVARACPLFVPLAEEGWTEGGDEVVNAVAKRYLADLSGGEIDTLVLGCTHYPLLRAAIAHVMGPGVTLVDSADATAESVEALLRARGLIRASGQGSHRYFVTDLPERFAEVGARFLGRKVDGAEQVDL